MNRKLFRFGSLLILAFAGCAAPGSHSGPPPGGWGKYVGPIRVQWEPGRKMRLLEDTHYIAPNGVDWVGPKGWEIDGASIPQAFWCTVGGPYEDLYRDASVFHDVACDQRKARWQDVHLMFYTAMRCSGVDDEKAKVALRRGLSLRSALARSSSSPGAAGSSRYNPSATESKRSEGAGELG